MKEETTKIEIELKNEFLEDIKRLGIGENQNEKIKDLLQKGLTDELEYMCDKHGII